MKTSYKYTALGISSLLLLGAAALLLIDNTAAQSVPTGSNFEQATELSKGKKQACLANNKTADSAVTAIKTKNIVQSFGLVLGSQILDIPAGYTDVTVHSFDGTEARGTQTYSDKDQQAFVGDLNSFNYTAVMDSKNNWNVTSFIACDKEH